MPNLRKQGRAILIPALWLYSFEHQSLTRHPADPVSKSASTFCEVDHGVCVESDRSHSGIRQIFVIRVLESIYKLLDVVTQTEMFTSLRALKKKKKRSLVFTCNCKRGTKDFLLTHPCTRFRLHRGLVLMPSYYFALLRQT